MALKGSVMEGTWKVNEELRETTRCVAWAVEGMNGQFVG